MEELKEKKAVLTSIGEMKEVRGMRCADQEKPNVAPGRMEQWIHTSNWSENLNNMTNDSWMKHRRRPTLSG